MVDEKELESAPIDVIWELRKLDTRFMDILDMIDELKAKDKSLSARISRLKLRSIEEEGEEIPQEEREEVHRELENMSIEDRAVLFAKLMDRQPPE